LWDTSSPGGPAFKGHVLRFTKNRLFRGIRLDENTIARGLTAKAFVADLERLPDADLEIDAIGDNALLSHLVTLSDRVPRLRIVINQLPFDSPPDEDAARKAHNALRELGRRPSVFAKVSGVLRRVDGRVPDEASFYSRSLDQLWDAFGVDRLVYGSNWPVSDLLAPHPHSAEGGARVLHCQGCGGHRTILLEELLDGLQVVGSTAITPCSKLSLASG
jgi:predicted TIM-barrel fold metal-dependent hydrolase